MQDVGDGFPDNIPADHRIADEIDPQLRPALRVVAVNFLGQKMVLEAPDEKFDAVLAEAKALIKKIDSPRISAPTVAIVIRKFSSNT